MSYSTGRRPTRRRLLHVSLAGLAGIGLVACGSSKNSGSSSNNTSGGTTQSAGASTSYPTIPAPAKLTGTLSGPGVTATTITIGEIATVTGPVPGLFQGAVDGLDAWAKWVNSNGGIDGRQVVIDHTDDGFNCTTYTNAMTKYATSAFAVLGNLTLEDTCGKTVLQANPNEIDIQSLALDPTLYSIPNVWTPAPTPPGGITTGLTYIKDHFPGVEKKAAMLIGQSAATNGKEEMLTGESLGYKYLYTRLVGNFETNFTSDILRMKSAGVQFIDMTDEAVTTTAAFLKQAKQQGYKPKIVYATSSYDTSLFKLLGDASLANNVVWSALPYAMYLGQDAATVPGVNSFDLALQAAKPGASANLFAVDAYSSGMLLLDAMQKAGSTINPSTVISALNGITSFNADGLLANYNPGQKQGTKCVIMAEVVNGAWKRVEPSSGFDCSGTYFNVSLSQLK